MSFLVEKDTSKKEMREVMLFNVQQGTPPYGSTQRPLSVLLRLTLTLTLFFGFFGFSFSFLGFFLFVYGPTLERCLYRPEIGPYMVWFYTWTTFVDNFVDKVLDDIFWFGYLVSL